MFGFFSLLFHKLIKPFKVLRSLFRAVFSFTHEMRKTVICKYLSRWKLHFLRRHLSEINPAVSHLHTTARPAASHFLPLLTRSRLVNHVLTMYAMVKAWCVVKNHKFLCIKTVFRYVVNKISVIEDIIHFTIKQRKT